MLGKTALGASSPANPACEKHLARELERALHFHEERLRKGEGVAYLDHTGSIVADEGLDVLGVSHFSPTGKARAKLHVNGWNRTLPAMDNKAVKSK
jgi:hypothetical protein